MKKLLVAGLAALLAACTEPENPNTVAPADRLLVTARNSKTQLKANGKDSTYLIARLPKDAGNVDVTFTSTGGTFVFSGTAEIKDYADSVDGSYRYATATLKADTLPKQVYATAEIASARNHILLIFSR